MRGAVLAGGSASRFNKRPKGLASVGGARILDRVSASIERSIGRPPVLIADPVLAAEWCPDLEVVGDEIPGCGSLGGIYTALGAGAGPVLVIAWDMPFVSDDLLRALVDGLEGYDALLPQSTGPLGVEPLCAVYGPRCRDAIGRQIRVNNLRTTAFHSAVRVGTLEVRTVASFGDPDELFFNVNTEADLSRARSLWQERQHR
jgi:molybdopterin-guanine dinucleotide biosynthesis protein A